MYASSERIDETCDCTVSSALSLLAIENSLKPSSYVLVNLPCNLQWEKVNSTKLNSENCKRISFKVEKYRFNWPLSLISVFYINVLICPCMWLPSYITSVKFTFNKWDLPRENHDAKELYPYHLFPKLYK